MDYVLPSGSAKAENIFGGGVHSSGAFLIN